MLTRLKAWAAALRQDVFALWLAARDRRTPLGAKLVAALVAAYALSPIDLIPDFIPVLGLVDDLLLVPLGLEVEEARRALELGLSACLVPVQLVCENVDYGW